MKLCKCITKLLQLSWGIHGMLLVLVLDQVSGASLDIMSHFLSSAEFLEEEAKERKITSKELKAAVEFFKIIVNRPDFTNQKFKQILKQGRKFLEEEMKKVLSV